MKTRLSIALFFAVAAAVSAQPAGKEAAFLDNLQKGQEKLDEGDFKEASRLLERAEQLSGGSFSSRIGLAQAYLGLGAYKEAARFADLARALASEPDALAQAYALLGTALYEKALRSTKAEDWQLTEKAYREALAQAGDKADPLLRFKLGAALLRQGRDDEGRIELERYLELDPEGRSVEHARSYLDNPRRARESLLPDLLLTTLEGDVLRDEDLLGKVVLIDFWGTWCQPCHEAVPWLRDLRRATQKEGDLVILSIATDSDERALRTFIEKSEMTWTHVWDRDRALSDDLFEVRRFPTYFLVDHTGLIQFTDSGWGSTIRDELERQIHRLLGKARKARWAKEK